MSPTRERKEREYLYNDFFQINTHEWLHNRGIKYVLSHISTHGLSGHHNYPWVKYQIGTKYNENKSALTIALIGQEILCFLWQGEGYA